MSPGHEGCPGGRAGRADQKPFEARALAMKLIEVGGFYPRIAVLAHGAVALVICDHQDNIGLLSESRFGSLSPYDWKAEGD